MNFCQCLNCEQILIDENPQTGAKEYEEWEFTNIENMKLMVDKDEAYWACPNCQTDSYLIDL